MWTAENRRDYERTGLRYPSDLTDAEWALAAPLIPPAKRGGRKRSVEVREVLNGIFYVLATGCQWRALPKDLPPRSTVHEYLQLWDWEGTLARLHHALYVQAREQAGKEASPTAAILDSQSVKGAEKGGRASTRRATTRARRSGARSATSWSTRSACSSPPRSTRRASRTGTAPCRC
jgi:transposase